MTGNTKVWRAPLAGLAAVAMLATMGVAASTANAAGVGTLHDDINANVSKLNAGKFGVRVFNADNAGSNYIYRFQRAYGDVITAADVTYAANAANVDHDRVLDYLSLDRAGQQKVSSPYVVTGHVKLFAHFKDAVTVTFDTNNNGKADDATSVVVPKGTALTADEYALSGNGTLGNTAEQNTASTVNGKQFVGWSTTYSASNAQSDLYTTGTFDKDTVLYPVYSDVDKAPVDFYDSLTDTTPATKYTLNNSAFPEFRAPSASGVWKAESAVSDDDPAYDFKTPVVKDANGKGLSLYDVTTSGLINSTIYFDFRGAYNTLYTGTSEDGTNHNSNTTKGSVSTASDQKIAEPAAPVKAGAVFKGWYKSNDNKEYDFSKSVADNYAGLDASKRSLYAKWDTTNVAQLVFNLDYADWANAQQTVFVNPGTETTLPFGLEDYYQTDGQADADNGSKYDPAAYTARQLDGWYIGANEKNVVKKFTAKGKDSVTSFTAKWASKAVSLKLLADGGYFDGDKTKVTKWVTKATGQSFDEAVTTPAKDGYTFVQWVNAYAYTAGTETYAAGSMYANLSDGYWYGIKTHARKQLIVDGDVLKATWKQGAAVDVEGYRSRFNLKFGADNKTEDVKTVANFGYTEDSAAKYVDAVNALEDDYTAWQHESDQVKKNALADALAPKYAAAEALLVKVSVDPSDPSNPFTDVLKGHTPHYSDIIAGYHAGLIQGWQEANGTVTFRPRTEVLRQDYAAFLYRLAGSPEFDVTKATKTFADVDSSTPHYKEILWAASNGVIGGFADGTFRGTDTIQRQDAMEMLYRLAGSPKVEDADKAFTDSSATPFAEAIAWAKAEGVSTGYEDGSFGVGRNIIRQDLAAFLNRAAAVLKK